MHTLIKKSCQMMKFNNLVALTLIAFFISLLPGAYVIYKHILFTSAFIHTSLSTIITSRFTWQKKSWQSRKGYFSLTTNGTYKVFVFKQLHVLS